MRRISALFIAVASLCAAGPLAVISVDGLDYRYLRDADRLGLKIPNMRRLMAEGASAQGVVGVWPTITWPSHTTMITGVRPDQHGILGNRRPKSEGGEYYWSAALLKSRTLWQAAHDRRLKTAAITWPVTADADIDYDLPEYFLRRNGGEMDLEGISQKATPGLIAAITAMFPSFPREWIDDRARALATIYLLRTRHPDLLLLHFVDHDSEAHDMGPYTREANATLEYTDELIGQILAAMPAEYTVALVSDHGFDRVDRIVNLRAAVQGEVTPLGGIVTTRDPAVAASLRAVRNQPKFGIGREIPHDELIRYAPALKDVVAAFEPADHVMFGPGDKDLITESREKGEHGFWPRRADYRSVFVLRGPGIRPERLGEIEMIGIAGRLAKILGVTL